MPNTLRVIAAPGLTVPCHDGKAQITAHRAVEVPDNAYYRRRMADGDLIQATPAPAAAPQNPEE